MREKEFGIWQDGHLGGVRRGGPPVRARSREARIRARRQARGDRRQPPAPVRRPARRTVGRRHLARGLPGLHRDRARLRARARGDEDHRGRERGAGGQALRDPGSARERGEGDLRRPARPRARARPVARVLSRRAGDGRRIRPRAPGPFRSRARGGRGRGHRDALLHLGHHRRSQGGDAHQRQPPLLRRGIEGRRGLADRGRAHRLPADGLGRRLVALGGGRDLLRSHHQLPGKPRDHAARLPGDRGNRHGRAARLLGGDAHKGAGPHGRGRLAEARALPAVHGRRGARGTDAAIGHPGSGPASRPWTRSATGSCAARFATSSA